MNDFPKISEGILGEQDTAKTNSELFLSVVEQFFPEAIKDGKVDFAALKEEFSEFAEIGSEHYDFTWAGKQEAKKEAQADLFGKSLRYKPEDSLNPDTTENIYIEGDNLEALKLLRRNYRGKIKMIYIDPPYNTGSDFVYHDDFSMSEEELAELSGDVVDGVRFQKNTKDSSKYHTSWLNMMYPRLKMARELLCDEGLIFISIDDNELINLEKLCEDIFGLNNRVGLMTLLSNPRGSQNSKYLSYVHEYILVYSKNINGISIKGIEKSEDSLSEYSESDENGKYRLLGLRKRGGAWRKEDRPNMHYPIYVNPKTGRVSLEESQEYCIEVIPKRPTGELGRWNWGKPKFIEENHLLIGKKVNRSNEPDAYDIFKKDYLNDESGEEKTTKVKTIWTEKETNYQNAKNEIKALFGNSEIFDFPKPTYIMEILFSMVDTGDEDVILDFFSGSASTAQAVMQVNVKRNRKNRFIMIQLPELTYTKDASGNEIPKPTSKIAYGEGYKNICQLGKERIRRAAKKIHEEYPDAVFDDGFKVFEVGKTNIRWNLMDDDELTELEKVSNDTEKLDFTDGHNDIDIVYEIMLRQYGIPLSTPVVKLDDVSDRTYIFADAVVVCLEPAITDELIEKLADIEPTPAKFVLRDSAFGDNIEFKDFSFRKLSALISSHQTEEERKSKYNNYTVEFI